MSSLLNLRGAALAMALVLPAGASAVEDEDKVDKPGVDLRYSPRMGFSPLSVLFTLELKGGGEHEDYYCPELEWEWGDGGRSEQESDCEPFVAGETTIQRRYTNRHMYQFAGVYNVIVRLKRVDRTVAKASARLTVRPGAGDPRRYE